MVNENPKRVNSFSKPPRKLKQEVQHPQVMNKSNTSMESENHSDQGPAINNSEVNKGNAAVFVEQLYRINESDSQIKLNKKGTKTPMNARNNKSMTCSSNRKTL